MTITWYFDFISPFAYLQWPRIRALADTRPIQFRPVLLAGLLDHWGHKGPAEIPGKREFTYRFAQWRAERAGMPLRFPPAHPFNPLPALRLCLAAGGDARAIEAIFQHLWAEGRRGDDIDSLTPVGQVLGIDDVAAAIGRPDVKRQLQDNFQAALAEHVFGVPTLVADGQLFWGEDATPMFEDFLADPGLFDSDAMRRLAQLPQSARRV